MITLQNIGKIVNASNSVKLGKKCYSNVARSSRWPLTKKCLFHSFHLRLLFHLGKCFALRHMKQVMTLTVTMKTQRPEMKILTIGKA